MNKIRWFSFYAIALALVFVIPWATSSAQGGAPQTDVPPAFMFGNAMLDGLPVPEGTRVVAMAGGEELGSAIAMQGGGFELQMIQPSTEFTVHFMVGNARVDYEYAWTSGDRMIMDLSATTGASQPSGATGSSDISPAILSGRAWLDGGPAPVGTLVFAMQGDRDAG